MEITSAGEADPRLLSALYGGILAVVFVLLALLSKIPLIGPIFFCFNFLLSLAAYFVVGYCGVLVVLLSK